MTTDLQESLTPLLDEATVDKILDQQDPIPIASLMKREMSEWSNDHEQIFANMGAAANGGKIFKTLSGYPNKIEGKQYNKNQLEAQIAEFVRFYGKNHCSRERLKEISLQTIRASPISDLQPDLWQKKSNAEKEVDEVFEMIYENIPEAKSSSSSSSNNSESAEPTPQDLSNVDVSRNLSDYEKKSRDLRKDLFGK
jgi:hypothetical protein